MADYSALYRLAPIDVSAPRVDLYSPLGVQRGSYRATASRRPDAGLWSRCVD
jgi:hypothetical protein